MIVTHAQILILRKGGAQTIRVPELPPAPGARKGLCPLNVGHRYKLIAPAAGQEKRQALHATVTSATRAGREFDVTFRANVDIEHRRFLGRSGGYTELEHLALRDEPEAIPAATQALFVKAAEAKAPARRKVSPELQQQLDQAARLERSLRDELDALFVDWTPQEIAAHAPHQGDAAKVRERRRAMRRRSTDGRNPLTQEQRAEWEAWLRQTGASVREIERVLDVSFRRAHELQQQWNTGREHAA